MMYRGYTMMPGPNDPGVIIRAAPEPHKTIGPVVASAPSYWEGEAVVDQLIADQPDQKKK